MRLTIRRRLMAVAILAAVASGGALVAVSLLARQSSDQRMVLARETVLREAERLRDTDDDLPDNTATRTPSDPFSRIVTGLLDGALNDPATQRPPPATIRAALTAAARASLQTNAAAVRESGTGDLRMVVAAAALPEGGFAWAAMRVPASRRLQEWQIGVWVLVAAMLLLVMVTVHTVVALRRGARALQGSLVALSTDLGAAVPRTDVGELREVADGIATLAAKLSSAQREHDRLMRALADRDRLASLGRVAAGVAHEVRNPLASMKLRADLAQRAHGVPDAVKNDLKEIANEIARLDRLVNDLLAVARKRSPALEAIELGPYLRARADAIGAMASERGIRFDVHGDAGVTVDRDGLTRAMDNLLRNAVEASPDGEVVTVAVAPSDDDAGARITVTDRGAGVADEFAAQLFEPFFTTKSAGTGLGLALTRAVAEAHGGGVAYARVGGATQFTLTLGASVRDSVRGT